MGVFIDYNPTAAFWVHDKIIPRPDTKLIISDHRRNHFIAEEIHTEIENHPDPEWRRVYARGLTGNITGICFPNWKPIQDDSYKNEVQEVIFGVDFGYTNDPTAIVKISIISKFETICEELMYIPSGDDKFIAEVLQQNGANDMTPIYCDHDKEIIGLLRRRGLLAVGAKKNDKGGDILKIRSVQVFYTPNSKNIHFERSRYCFKHTDDIVTNIPDDRTPHHCMDAIRYAIYTHFLRMGYFIELT
jgi:phage terminase large subunit